MKRHTFSVIFCFVLLCSAATIHGQGFTGPTVNNNQAVMISRPVMVSEARNLPDDSWVMLTGNIVSGLPGSKAYIFRDATGEITVEIDRKVWRGLSAGVSDRVTISGELEIKRGQAIIEVKAITSTDREVPARPGQAVTVTRPITIGEARNLPHDSWVILTGNIVNSLSDKKYTFRDSTGEITVEIDRDKWRGLSVGASDRVEISGELKLKNGQYSVKVKAIRKL
jgi:uncharacterized protein (TIGR00156 family)